MFQRSAQEQGLWQDGIFSAWVRTGKGLMAIGLLALGIMPCRGQTTTLSASTGWPAAVPSPILTNTAQIKGLSANDFLGVCALRLQGVVTLVDTNRNLVVLQDATGALALHFDFPGAALIPGQLVLLEGANCHPYVESFPDYPFHPAGREIRALFEGPTDWGDYYLTRMRGFLHPPATGDYTFWIASDNSSELWLSQDDNPSKARKIAFIPEFNWVKSREWSRFPSQRSDTIRLVGGATYYIEARQEQTTKGDNLAVSWSGPGLAQSVIDGSFISPCVQDYATNPLVETNGILREYWTNYSAGTLKILTGRTPFDSSLSVAQPKISILGQGTLPEARLMAFDQPLPLSNDFCRVRVEGTVKFAGINGNEASLQLADGETQIQVRFSHWEEGFPSNLCNSRVRVEGVWEGGRDPDGHLEAGLIWASADNFVALSEPTKPGLNERQLAQGLKSAPTDANPVMDGYYATQGVVTFNDRVLGEDCLFVQQDAAVIFVSLEGRNFKRQLAAGQRVELGGLLKPGRNIPTMKPLVLSESGWSAMPEPIIQPVQFPIPGNLDGRWTEIEGVVRSVNSNGTLSLWGKDSQIYLWIGKTPPSELGVYEDARVRVRGVLSLTRLDSPLLLIPSRDYLSLEEAGPKDPFNLPIRQISGLPPETTDYSMVHRAKIKGQVIFRLGRSIFIQDASGGIQAEMRGNPAVAVGTMVEAVGFPMANGTKRLLTETLVQVTGETRPVKTRKLDLNELMSSRQNFTLVQAIGTLLSQKSTGPGKVLELEDHDRVFTAIFSDSPNGWPQIAPGSRVEVTGVCDQGGLVSTVADQGPVEGAAAGSLTILLRSPADAVVLRGPPWWTLRRTVALVGTLLAVLTVTLLWVHLLRRRLVRQQAARLAFSRQILQGQENERQRIAVNLHDSLGQNLLVIKNQARLAMQSNGHDPDKQNRLSKISEITSIAIDEVRQITRDLRPYQLDRLGLTQAIRAIVSQASENSQIQIATYLDSIDDVFDQESEIHIYRVVQEALNNILKHSAATEAAVVVKNLTNLISLSIRDNGRGFDPDLAESSFVRDIGYGLSGMKERTRILGGRFTVESRLGQGTSITIEIMKPTAKA